MRLLDCKSPICQEIGKGAPMMLDFLCEECTDHFEQVKAGLDAMDIPYVINPKIVRGLDYYTKTVFEFVTDKIGAQSTPYLRPTPHRKRRRTCYARRLDGKCPRGRQ